MCRPGTSTTLETSRTTRMNKVTEKAPDRTEAQSSQKRQQQAKHTKDETQWNRYFGDQSWISHMVQSLHWHTQVKKTELAENKPSRKIRNGFLCLATISLLHTVTWAGRTQEHLNCCETSLFDLASESESNRKVLTQMNKKERHNESAL